MFLLAIHIVSISILVMVVWLTAYRQGEHAAMLRVEKATRAKAAKQASSASNARR